MFDPSMLLVFCGVGVGSRPKAQANGAAGMYIKISLFFWDSVETGYNYWPLVRCKILRTENLCRSGLFRKARPEAARAGPDPCPTFANFAGLTEA